MGPHTTAEEKYQAKQRRRKGLQKTRFYCQVCSRQCLDENGFKCHVQSAIHVQNLQKQLESHGGSSKRVVNDFSSQFMDQFVLLLKKSHGVKMIGANKFYQEYIANKDHVHLNSTKWKFLVNAILAMQQEGKIKVSEGNGLQGEQYFIGYIDNSPEAVKRRKKLEHQKMLEESGLANNDDVAIDPEMAKQIAQAEQLKKQLDEQKRSAAVTEPPAPEKAVAVKQKVSFGLKAKLAAKKSIKGAKLK